MAKKRVKLTHSSNHPEAAGEPGQVIECEAAIADRFISGGGAELVETVPASKPVRRKKTSETK